MNSHNLHPEVPATEAIDIHFNATSYPECFNTAAGFCPEVAEQKDKLVYAAQKMIEFYRPSSDFFDAPDNAVALIFSSALLVDAETSTHDSPARSERKFRLADNFGWLTFGDYSQVRPHEDIAKVSDLPAAERIALFRKYENPELSARLGSWMAANEELEEVRDALGISSAESRDFVPMVLRVGGDVHMKGIGKNPSGPDMRKGIASWKEAGKRFMKEQGSASDDTVPFAWVSTLEGEKYLCFPEPIAQALLEPDVVGFEDDGGVIELLRALVKHEYVHVQGGGKLVDPNGSEKSQRLGLLLHEYHAEVFSGKYFDYAYPEAYNLSRGIWLASGVEIDEVLKGMKNGGGSDKAMLYLSIANQIGLIPTAMLLGTMSKNHAKFQAPKAGRLLADDLETYPVSDELALRGGVEGVAERFKRAGITLLPEAKSNWEQYLQTLANT